MNLLEQLNQTINQLSAQTASAQHSADAAEIGVTIANTKSKQLAAQITNLQHSLDSGGFFQTLGSALSTVGAIAGAIGAIYTGVGAIIDIPEALISVGEDMDVADDFIEFLNAAENQPDIKELGKDLSGISDGAKGIINLNKVIKDLSNGGRDDSNGALSKLAEAVKEKKIADLRVKQANAQLEAAQALAHGLTNALHAANDLQSRWANEVADLVSVMEQMLAFARQMADLVADDVFLSTRALEIYQLQKPMSLRFDYGYVHPDDDLSLPLATRASQCMHSLGNLDNAIITNAQLYAWLNLAQIGGYNVVHPAFTHTITDQAILAALNTDDGMAFSTIGSSGIPVGDTELKVSAVKVEAAGVQSSQIINLRLEHSGDWIMEKRGGNETTVFSLLPRSEDVPCQTSETTHLLTGSIPSVPVAANDIPFSFWGRGALAKWRLYVQPADRPYFVQVSQITFSFYCTGFSQSH